MIAEVPRKVIMCSAKKVIEILTKPLRNITCYGANMSEVFIIFSCFLFNAEK